VLSVRYQINIHDCQCVVHALGTVPSTELVCLSAYSLCSGPRDPGIVDRHVSSKRLSVPTFSSTMSKVS